MPEQIDSIVCTEIPDPQNDPLLFEIVKANMVHGPCGTLNLSSHYMREGKCTKRFLRQLLRETIKRNNGYPQYRRRAWQAGGFTVKRNGNIIDNRWVLSPRFRAHINIEYCSSVKSIKYICKYVNKGIDQASFTLTNHKDEVKMYKSGRYISSSEVVWRILAFPIHERFPTVIHLAVHLKHLIIKFNCRKGLLNHLTLPY